MTQGEVRDPAPSPTACITLSIVSHEPVRFDWVSEVNDFLGLSPVVSDNNGTIVHVQGTPQPVPVNPKLGQPGPANTVPVDPDPGNMALHPTPPIPSPN